MDKLKLPSWWKSRKWEIYLVPERALKDYEGMDKDKYRPVIILNNDYDLFFKSIVVEVTTKKHPGYIKLDGLKFLSYIAIDRIHTIDNCWLDNKHHIPTIDIPKETKIKVVEFLVDKINKAKPIK